MVGTGEGIALNIWARRYERSGYLSASDTTARATATAAGCSAARLAQDAAMTELRELAGGRADLLAEVARIFEGASEGELDEPLAAGRATMQLGWCR